MVAPDGTIHAKGFAATEARPRAAALFATVGTADGVIAAQAGRSVGRASRLIALAAAVLLAGCAGAGRSQALAPPPAPPVSTAAPSGPPALVRQFASLNGSRTNEEAFVDGLFDRIVPDLENLAALVTWDGVISAAEEAEGQMLNSSLYSDDYATAKRAAETLAGRGQRIERQLRQQAPRRDDPVGSLMHGAVMSSLARTRDQAYERLVSLVGARINRLADTRTLGALQYGLVKALEGGRLFPGEGKLATWVLRRAVKTRDDELINGLRPLLTHPDVEVSVFVVREIGSSRDHEFFPELLFDALRSPREAVVAEAINWTPNCWDRERSSRLREALRAVFSGSNEKLKFQAAFPLMHGYADLEAITYLLEQTANADPVRAATALRWVGDACNTGRREFPALLERLVPLLQSEKPDVRRAAVNALGNYSGEEVTRILVPMLADPDLRVASAAAEGLEARRGPAGFRQLLEAELERTPPGAIADKLRALLSELKRSPTP